MQRRAGLLAPALSALLPGRGRSAEYERQRIGATQSEQVQPEGFALLLVLLAGQAGRGEYLRRGQPTGREERGGEAGGRGRGISEGGDGGGGRGGRGRAQLLAQAERGAQAEGGRGGLGEQLLCAQPG